MTSEAPKIDAQTTEPVVDGKSLIAGLDVSKKADRIELMRRFVEAKTADKAPEEAILAES